jgi:hypothetical protein
LKNSTSQSKNNSSVTDTESKNDNQLMKQNDSKMYKTKKTINKKMSNKQQQQKTKRNQPLKQHNNHKTQLTIE